MAIPTQSLEEELRAVWKHAYHVVFKDLPRLAKRTSIFVSGQLLVKEGVRVSNDQYKENCRGLGRRGKTLRLKRIGQYSSSGPDVLVSPRLVKQKSIEKKASSLAQTSVCDNSSIQPTPFPVVQPEAEPQVKVLDAIGAVILTLSSHLEDDKTFEEYSSILQQLTHIDKQGEAYDMESVLMDLFSKVPHLRQTRTFKVLQVVHQEVLFPAIYRLKTSILSHIHTRDVRRPDGWQIIIGLGDRISVTHERWEQSMAGVDSPNHYELQWSVCCSFDQQMSDLKASILRLTDIRIHPDMPVVERVAIETAVCGANLIVE